MYIRSKQITEKSEILNATRSHDKVTKLILNWFKPIVTYIVLIYYIGVSDMCL